MERIFVSEVLASSLLGAQVGHAKSDGKFENNNRVGAKTSQDGRYRRVEAGEYGAHTNDRTGSDDHTQNCEERAQLVRADGLQGQSDTVREGEPRQCYFSARKASIGSSLAA